MLSLDWPIFWKAARAIGIAVAIPVAFVWIPALFLPPKVVLVIVIASLPISGGVLIYRSEVRTKRLIAEAEASKAKLKKATA